MIHLADNITLAVDFHPSPQAPGRTDYTRPDHGHRHADTVVTLVQGANVYVEQKIANLGANVFRVGRLPFAVTDFALLTRAQRHKFLYPDDMPAPPDAGIANPSALRSTRPLRLRYADHQLDDSALHGHTPTMAEIDAHRGTGTLLHRR